MKIYELEVNELEDGVNMVALVDNPAIKRNWIAFADEEFESITDYPQGISDTAQRVLNYVEDNGWGSCGTDVGKQRANQLAKREPISMETVKRMYSFLARHKGGGADKGEYGDGCGKLMYDAWGGDAGLSWSERIVNKANEEMGLQKFKVQDEEKRVVTGPLMVANLPIYRFNEEMGDHYVVFRPDTIEKIVLKFFRDKKTDQANIMHDGVKVDGVFLFESFIIDDRKTTPIGFDKLPNGSWFGSFKVENDEVWAKVKAGEFAGFSVEGMFAYGNEKDKEDELLAKLLEVLRG
jgi:hypothetical protein